MALVDSSIITGFVDLHKLKNPRSRKRRYCETATEIVVHQIIPPHGSNIFSSLRINNSINTDRCLDWYEINERRTNSRNITKYP
jgi:hypothetical protein